MATEKQINYIKILIEKKLDLWQADSVGAQEIAHRNLYTQARETAYATITDDRKAARKLKNEILADLRENREARIQEYIQVRRDYYSNLAIPDSVTEASALIDSLK